MSSPMPVLPRSNRGPIVASSADAQASSASISSHTFRHVVPRTPELQPEPNTHDSDDDTAELLLGAAVVAGAAWGMWRVGKWMLKSLDAASAGPSVRPSTVLGFEVLTEGPAAATLTLSAFDIALIDLTFDSEGIDLWSAVTREVLKEIVEDALTESLPEGVEFAVAATSGSLRLRIAARWRPAWNGSTGEQQDASSSGVIDVKQLTERIRMGLQRALRHPIQTLDWSLKRIGEIRDRAETLKWLWKWLGRPAAFGFGFAS